MAGACSGMRCPRFSAVFGSKDTDRSIVSWWSLLRAMLRSPSEMHRATGDDDVTCHLWPVAWRRIWEARLRGPHDAVLGQKSTPHRGMPWFHGMVSAGVQCAQQRRMSNPASITGRGRTPIGDRPPSSFRLPPSVFRQKTEDRRQTTATVCVRAPGAASPDALAPSKRPTWPPIVTGVCV